MDMVMEGMQPPNPVKSSKGRQRHSPYFLAVIQVKQGKHQNAKQPERKKQQLNTPIPRHTYKHNDGNRSINNDMMKPFLYWPYLTYLEIKTW